MPDLPLFLAETLSRTAAPGLLVLAASSLLLFAACSRGASASGGHDPAPKTAATQPATQPAACGLDPSAGCGTAHWAAKTDEEWRKLLTPEQYRVAREAGTERAFTGKYWNTKTKGVYHCAACSHPLFSSEAKFDSGTGWPSYWQPIAKDRVTEHADRSHGMVRVEVRCAQCGAHLGHLFDDGPPPTGQRYCINSAVLNLVTDGEGKK